MDKELAQKLNTGCEYNSVYMDMIDFGVKWCGCANDVECKELLQKLSFEKGIFVGEFVKAILKVNNMALELEKVAELLGDVEFLSIVKKIPELTLKYIVTNQSLYV